MSLIIQALKKEQQRRSLNLKSPSIDIPTYDSEPLTASRLSRSGRSKNTLPILLGFTALGAVLLLGGGAFVYFGKSYLANLNLAPIAAEATDSETANTASLASSNLSNSLSGALAGNQLRAEATNAITTESAVASQENTLSAPLETEAALDLPEASNRAPAETATVGPVAEKPEFNLEIQNFIDELQVHGFRSAGANSRLLMNGRVFKLNDIVSHELAIRFKGSRDGALVFEDSLGYQYEKPL